MEKYHKYPKVYSCQKAADPYSKLAESNTHYETAFEIHVYKVKTCKTKIKNYSLDETLAHSTVTVTNVIKYFANQYAL
jgi:hypothetical protein